MDNEPAVSEIDEQTPEPSSWPVVIGVISIVYAIIGMLCQSVSALGGLASEYFMSLGGLEVEVPATIKIFSGVSLVLVWGLGLLLLVGGVKVMRRRRSGITVLRQWVIARLVLLALGVGASVFMMPASVDFQRQIMEAQAENVRASGRPDLVQEFDEDRQWRQSMIMTGVMTAVVAVYPLFLGFYLSRAAVRDRSSAWD